MSASVITDAARIQTHMQFPYAVTAGVASQSLQLKGGLYDIWFSTSADMYVKVGPSVSPIPDGADQPAIAPANDVTLANGYLVRAGNTITVFVPYGARLGAISATAGNLCAHKVGE